MMRNLLYVLLAVVTLSSCFNTKVNEEAAARQHQIETIRHKDSIWVSEHTPDTNLVAFKRTMVCDGKQMVAFDRVTLLSGSDAQEYSVRHNRFLQSQNVVVNKEVVLETLPLSSKAIVQLLEPGPDGETYVRSSISDVNDIILETVLQIVIYNKSIIHLKEMRYEKD